MEAHSDSSTWRSSHWKSPDKNSHLEVVEGREMSQEVAGQHCHMADLGDVRFFVVSLSPPHPIPPGPGGSHQAPPSKGGSR